MSHPTNRRERFLKGKHLGEKRALGIMCTFRDKRDFKKWAYLRRNTTTLCSCSMCGNPRRKAWKGKDKLTKQEKKFEEGFKKDL